MPRENKRDKSHWKRRQNDIENYWAGRQAQLKGNVDEKTRHFDKISGPGCRSYADELLEHSEIAEALDPILHIPGLRAGFWLKMMHNVIYTRCNEQILLYLKFIKNTWDFIAGSMLVDAKTVQALEKRCPRYSQNDEQHIANLIDGGQIFEDYDPTWKAQLKKRIGRLQVAIPSLDTFFDDWRILKDCSLSLSNLIPRKRGQSYTSALSDSYRDDDQYFHQRLSDMWVMALRCYADTQPQPSRPEEELKQRPRTGPPDAVTLHYMAIFARNQGFKSDQITRHASNPQALEKTTDCVNPLATSSSNPSLSQGPGMQYKSGYPDMASFRHDRPYLSWENFSSGIESTQDANMSTFCRLRTLCFAFFRLAHHELPLASDSEEMPRLLPDADISTINSNGVEHNAAASSDKVQENTTVTINSNGVEHNVAASSDQVQESNTTVTKRPRNHDIVYFKTNRRYQWEEICRVEEASPESVKSMADSLTATYYLLCVWCIKDRTWVKSILPDDCWGSAEYSTINTIIIWPKKTDSLDLDTIASLALELYRAS